MKRRLILWLLVILFLWLIFSHFADFLKLLRTLMTGQPVWILLAVLSQITYYFLLSFMYKSAFNTVEVKSRVRDLLPVVFGSLFLNVVTLSGGAAGAALFVDDAARRGESPARATAGTLLTLASDFAAFSFMLIGAMIYLSINHDLKFFEIIAAAILIAITSAMAGVLALGWRSPVRLHRLLAAIQRMINGAGRVLLRLLRRKNFSEEKAAYPILARDWADKNSAEFVEAAGAIAAYPLRLLRTLGIAFAAHTVDLMTLFLLFTAFGEQIRFGPLIAGYAMGILFWLVSITPQGIGVVEGVMALTYASLGVRPEVATVVSLAFRGLTFWIPLALGFVLVQRLKSFGTAERSKADVWNVRVVAILTGTMGVVNIISGILPSLADRLQTLRRISPLEVRTGGHLTSVLAGFALLLLAGYLWRRKRLAWVITLGVLVISIFSYLLKGLNYEEAALSGVLAIWLFTLRDHFHARSDPPSIWQGIRVLLFAFVFTLAYGTLGFYLLDRQFRQAFSLASALRETITLFTQFYDPGLVAVTGYGRFFIDSIYIVGVVTFGFALLMLARPVLIQEPASAAQRAYARKIVEKYGHTSLANYTLLPDKSYHFSPGGSMVAYVQKNRVALALGDPIGPAQDRSSAIQSYKEHCEKNDWVPAFYQTLPDYLEDYRSHGFNSVLIGHEAIIDLASFSLEGHENKPLRNAVNRLARLGYSVQFHDPPIPGSLLEELRDVSDEWLTKKHSLEMRYSLGWFNDDYMRGCQIAAVCSPEEQLIAFTNLAPEYQQNGQGVDMLRHLEDIENGTMDFLLAEVILHAKAQGYETFDLGLSALSMVGSQNDDPAIERALNYIYRQVRQLYNFQGLYEFKDKFHPIWSPRYIIFPSPASLPAIAIALVTANTGQLVPLNKAEG